MDPILITMDTSPNKEGLRFLKTLNSNGWKYRLIGTDTDWVNFLYRAGLYLKEFITIASKTPDRICVVSDCRDVLCVRSPKAFVEAFNTYGKDIVVSSEILCGGYPIRDPGANVNCEDSTPYWNANGVFDQDIPFRKYVNAGLIAGKASALVKMYNWMLETGTANRIADDQVLMGMYVNAFPSKIAMDSEAELLHTSTFGASAGLMTYSQQYDSPSIAEILGRRAFFLHLPGAGMGSGNGLIYDIVCKIIDEGYTYKDLIIEKLGVKEEWPWKKYQFDKFNKRI